MQTAHDHASVEITWCGHAAFHVRQGRHAIYIDPFLTGNPQCPQAERAGRPAEAVFVTHGHSHHLGDVGRLARERGMTVVCGVELGDWLVRQGVPTSQIVSGNVGGLVIAAGVKARFVRALHSSSVEHEGVAQYCGAAVGYVFEFPNGFRIYHTGDTGLFGDMALIGEMHHPNLALLPIGGFSTMGPRDAAYACRLLRTASVVPMHYATYPELTGTPDELRRHLDGNCEVVELVPGVAWNHHGAA